MILTGRLLQETAKDVWGDNWVAILAKRLKVSKRTIQRWRNEENAMPADLRRSLLDMIETQLAILGERRNLLIL
jgi:hypothetical protein